MTTYMEMENPMYSMISDKITMSYPNSCICWIEEIVNDELRQEYTDLKTQITTKYPKTIEMQLFHDTKESSVNNIINTGFNPSYNKTSAYGIGTYFATYANYSKDYMPSNKKGISFMFLCDVIVGKMCIGKSSMVIDTTLYDNAVNQLNPTIVVTPYKNGAYPRYLIAFHKNANFYMCYK